MYIYQSTCLFGRIDVPGYQFIVIVCDECSLLYDGSLTK